ncbi:MAG: hypothetical protein WAU00_11205, partial [Caldilinea sp.]
AEAGQPREIVKVLSSAGMAEAEAELLAANLITPSALTALTIVAKRVDQTAQRRDCIYWQSEANHSALLIIYDRVDAETSQPVEEVLITDGSKATLLSLFNEMAC